MPFVPYGSNYPAGAGLVSSSRSRLSDHAPSLAIIGLLIIVLKNCRIAISTASAAINLSLAQLHTMLQMGLKPRGRYHNTKNGLHVLPAPAIYFRVCVCLPCQKALVCGKGVAIRLCTDHQQTKILRKILVAEEGLEPPTRGL